MTIIRPRLNDYHGLPFTQEEVDFAIPFLDEDLPLYVDPFLMWKSPSLQDQALHTSVINSFNHLGALHLKGESERALGTLIRLSECNEAGLGTSRTRTGRTIGQKTARDILSLYTEIPQVRQAGFVHFEEIQLLVDGISRDRISDFACSLTKSFLMDFTIDQCKKWNIPVQKSRVEVYDYRTHVLVEEEVELPQAPESNNPIILVPRRWLRFIPWINYEDYFRSYYAKEVEEGKTERVSVLNYNRQNYALVRAYVAQQEKAREKCGNDPLFRPISILSANRKFASIEKLPTGTAGKADKKYEDQVCSLMASLVYPHLDFAQEQSRTDSGVLIRDLIFYSNRSSPFLRDVYDEYDCRQVVFELKNVRELDREHINQLNRYLKDQFGRFGVIVARNRPPRRIYQNTIDLWSGQRKCVLILADEDLKLMCQVYSSKQRRPIDVLNKKYVEFTRACPS